MAARGAARRGGVFYNGDHGLNFLLDKMPTATRAALPSPVRQLHANDRIPITNTASGLMPFEC